MTTISRFAAARAAATSLTSYQTDPIAQRYVDWIEAHDRPELAAAVLASVAETSKHPDRVLANADDLYLAKAPVTPVEVDPLEDDVEGILGRLAALESAPPPSTLFRGAWTAAPDRLVYSNDFSGGNPFDNGLTTAMNTWPAANPPAFQTRYETAENMDDAHLVSTLDLTTLPELTGLNITRVTGYFSTRINIPANQGGTGYGLLKVDSDVVCSQTIVGVGTTAQYSPWEPFDKTLTFGNPAKLTIETWNSTTGLYRYTNASLANLRIYSVDDTFAPYMTGEVVYHAGLLWKSDIDNNTATPGVSGWTQALDNQVLLLEAGQGAADVPASTPVGTIVFTKA